MWEIFGEIAGLGWDIVAHALDGFNSRRESGV
jgi:hypothetical protein